MTQKPKQVRINDILAQNRTATRDELNNLYFQVVCEATCSDVVEIMSDEEIKRLVAIRLLEFWIIGCQHNTGFVIKKTVQLIGLNRATLYNYIKEYGIKSRKNG
jgi:DNA-binding NtrC family response regulator